MYDNFTKEECIESIEINLQFNIIVISIHVPLTNLILMMNTTAMTVGMENKRLYFLMALIAKHLQMQCNHCTEIHQQSSVE